MDVTQSNCLQIEVESTYHAVIDSLFALSLHRFNLAKDARSAQKRLMPEIIAQFLCSAHMLDALLQSEPF